MPSLPEGNDEVVIVNPAMAGDAAPTAIETVSEATCAGESASLTVTPNENVPLTLGVPEMMPLEAASDMPSGS